MFCPHRKDWTIAFNDCSSIIMPSICSYNLLILYTLSKGKLKEDADSSLDPDVSNLHEVFIGLPVSENSFPIFCCIKGLVVTELKEGRKQELYLCSSHGIPN